MTFPPSSPRRAVLLLALAGVVPVVYLLVVFWLQPATYLGDPPDAPDLGRAFYDDYDVAAMAQRGLNAACRRRAGLPDEDDLRERTTLDPVEPYQERYFLEYPHTALLLFEAGFVVQPDFDRSQVPPALLDFHYHRLIEFQPSNERDQRLILWIRHATRFYETCMVLAGLLLMVVLWIGYEPGRRYTGSPWFLLLPGTLYFTLNRFDILPALLVALCLFCTGRRWLIGSACLLAFATAVKVYPLVLAPLVWRYLATDRRSALVWAGAYGVSLAGLLLPPFLTADATHALAPYKYQLDRAAWGEWTIYGYLLPEDWRTSEFRLGCFAVVGLLCFWQRPRELAGLLRRCQLMTMLFVILPVFWSPQWLIWFTPLLIPLARRQWAIGVLYVAIDLLSYVSFPLVFDNVGREQHWIISTVIYLRFALLGVLVGVLVWGEWCDWRSIQVGTETEAAE